MAKVANLKSSIQSKIQKDVTSMQQKTASSTEATQAGSTITPEVTSTPKVTQTAKAMPSITRPDISQIATPTVSQTPSTRDLFAPSTTPTLRKADTPDLLGGDTEQKGLSGLLNKWLYEKPQEITQKFTETDLFDKSKNIIIDTARFGISTVQGWLERYGDSPIVGLPKSVQEGEIGTKIKEQRNETLKSVFDELESRDQGISKDKGYEEAKKRAEEWSASGKSMRQALQEGNWDVYLTRGGEIIAQIIPALATSIITKNPKAVAGTVFTTVYGDAYKRNLTDVVKDPDFKDLTGQQKTDLASLLALTEAGIETIGDMVELAPFMKGKTSIAKMLGIKNAFASFIANWQGSAFTEGLEEVSTEALQTRIKQAYGSLDSISLKELWQIFSDTYALMQVAGLPGGAGGVVETRNRNRATDELSREADKYDNFNDFEAAAERGGVEDKEIIQDAWAKSKGLTSKQTEILKYDVNYVENQEKKTTKLYEEREETENKINKLKEEGEERNKSQITKLENRVQEIDNQINEIDKSIQEYMELYGEQNASEEKELEELHAEVNQSIEGEDLSGQTTKVPEQQGSIKVRQVAPGRNWDKKDMRKVFEKSVNDIKSGTYYGDTEFAGYAYYNTSTMTKDTKDVMKMRAKVEDLLRKIGVTIRYTSNPDRDMGHGLAGIYEPSRKRVTYASGENGVQIYGHEVFHAIMDIIHNGKITDKELQTKLKEILDKAINDVKKQFGIDIYKEGTEEFDIANTFAEEWLSNSFGEYLAKRELEGPKTFVQKIKEFFKQIISLFSKEGMTEMSLNKELRDAFESIANGEVIKEKPASFNRRGLMGESLGGRTGFKIPTTTEGFLSLAEALKQPQNTILSTLTELKLKELKTKAQDMWRNEGFFGKNNEAYRLILRKINDELSVRQEQEKTSGTKKLTFKNAGDYIKKMIAIDKANGDWTRRDDKALRYKYMSNFLRTNLEGDFSAHLPGLKGVNLKQIEGKLSIKNLKDITEMLSLVSATLGIDFNKVIMDKYMSMNIADDIKDFKYHTDALGLMSRKATKDMIKELSEREGGYLPATLGADIATMGVAITLQDGPMKSGATMAHELMHLIDFALSVEEGLPLYFEGGKFTYTSIIKDDNSWKTYTVGNYNSKYYNRWQEIIARYSEQYFAYKNDKKLFDEFAKRPWYWTEEEFMKLLPKFESFIKNRLGAKLLDEQNQFYNDIVRRINENKFSTISTDFDKEGLREDEVKYKLEQLKEEYVWIMEHIDEMTGTLKEEMEAYVQLSNIQTNYEMAKAKGEEYLEKLKTTPEQQGTIDGVTTTVLPPEPEPGNPNPTPPQNPETIRLGLPYYGGSNIEEGIGDIAEGGDGPQLGNSYTKEEDIIKIRKRKNKIKNFRKELGQAWKDIFTPTISRIYNISPRIAGRLITMETQKDINIHRYRQKARGFVETLGKLKGKQALEVKMALLDYGALASEQGENIEQYKKDEVAKLKEVLLRNGFKEQDINDMFSVLDDIGQQYKDAGLSVTLTDMYFPRVVKDYEGLIDYMNRVSGNDIKINKASLLLRIKQIQNDPNLSDEEKEKRIRHAISVEFKQPGTTSQHGKERKMGKLSDWGEGIFAYYENPIESIDHYIVTMTNAIQRQLFLGGLKEDANTDADIINQDTTESVSQIIGKLVEDGMINEEDVEELQKSILAVLNKKPSPKSVTALKDITYIATITNFLSAINQLDDLGMVILKDRSGLKHIVKAIFGKANIKYDDLGLEDSYEMFREEGGITNWLFKKSLFNFFDRLGKTSFINAAWESMVRQSKNEKTRKFLYTRLVSMYGQESADRMMEKIDSGNYMGDDGQIDIEILRDLLYQLGSTQPIYTSAMSTTYLNHPWARLCYALSSFTLKRIDWLVQGAKEVNAKHGTVAAGAWVMGVSAFLAMFGAAIGDVGDLLKGKKEETFLWQLINNGIEDALKSGGSDALNSWLKIWDLSEYDLKTYKSQGIWGVLSSKIKPFIFDLGKDITEAITEHDKDEITDLAKYVPIFGKLVYYWCWSDLKETTKSDWNFDMDMDWDFGGALTDTWDWEDDEEWDFS